MTQPLRGLNLNPRNTAALAGCWGAYILAKDATGFTIRIPDLTGDGAHGRCQAVPDFTWVVGEAVWVQAINGNRGQFLIFAHRQREPT